MDSRPRSAPVPAQVLDALRDIVGDGAWISDPDALEPHVTEWRGRLHGRTPLLVRPGTTAQVSEVLRTCHAAGVGVVPQGGNTGMCGGAVPDADGSQVVLNLGRMDAIESVDADNYSLVAEAGCILSRVQSAAREAGRYFPLSLGGEDSCQIGGNVATNAGGINVLRYGMTRDLVLGLEVVLADGTVWDGLRALRKDNAGFDLKQCFIGSEGTLGVITRVSIKLFPDPGPVQTVMLALPDAISAVRAYAMLRERHPDRIQAFELIGATPMRLVLRHVDGLRNPFRSASEWYVLADFAASQARVEESLAAVLERGLAEDAVVAKSLSEAEALWRLRHSISEAERREGPGVKHDVSVPLSRLQEFLGRAAESLERAVPGVVPVVFGHLGDGNLHYNAILRTGDGQPGDTVTRVIYDLVTDLGGSISAEHGIGVFKKSDLAARATPATLRLMRSLKDALDPAGILNPGKVI